MITVRAGSAAIGVCLLLLAAGCSREQQDWRSAETADTIEAYGQFIQQHPQSELATQARTRVVQLGEDRDWQHAGSADTVDAYRQFIEQYPNGKWAQEARIRIENFSLGEQAGTDAGSRAGRAGRGAADGVGLAVPGEAASAAPGINAQASDAVRLAGFGVQLGAFSSEANANSEWRVLVGRFGPELQGLQQRLVATETPSGRIYRLQAAVGDEARARAICDSLRKRSQPCVAVLPH